MAVTLGSDPEVFLARRNDTTAFVPAVGQIGGTKGEPIPIPGMPKGFMMQEDNVMLEFNTPPSSDWMEFLHLNYEALAGLDDVLAPKKLQIARNICYAEFSEADLDTPQAREFGCLPDMDAYSGGAAPPIGPADLGRHRLAGGHIHLGFNNPANIPTFVIAQLCDVVALHEVLFGGSQGPRRQFYGSAGRYREKPYGIEYRTLSNKWLFESLAGQHLASGLWHIAAAVDRGDIKAVHRAFAEIPWAEVRRALANEDETLSEEIIRFCRDNGLVAGGHAA